MLINLAIVTAQAPGARRLLNHNYRRAPATNARLCNTLCVQFRYSIAYNLPHSGREAARRESDLAVRLLEPFLQAGISARRALATLSGALALRGEDTGGFTTVDLLQVDLFTGEGELFKLGAAPTYVKQGAGVSRLTGASLPAGLGDGPPTDRFTLKLVPGDTVVMVSDGVCASGEDDWLRRRLEGFDGASPKDLARELITDAPQDSTDDRTALVIRIERRV